MAKVVITIEDVFNGSVKCVMEPSFETMMAMNMSGHKWTSAQAYAVFMVNQLRKKSKDFSDEGKIIRIPGKK